MPDSPVAVVEDVSGKPAGVEFMDYVAAGKVIKLAAQESLVLGYIKSCWRETIRGGTVTVGDEWSDVQGGTVERARMPCDGVQDGTLRPSGIATERGNGLSQAGDGEAAVQNLWLLTGR